MKYAADFRKIARDALRGHWIIATLVCYLASLIGASIVGTGSFSFNFNTGGSGSNGGSGEEAIPEVDISIENIDWAEIMPMIVIFAVVFFVAMLFAITIHLVVGGPGKLGYAKFNLALVDHEEARVGDLFSQFGRFADGFLLNLLTGLYTFLWSLLFIIPGIVKTYSYAMTPYILYENPDLSVNEAITASRKLMDGNKGRLFCLNFSFIGWSLLATTPILLISVMAAVAALTESVALIALALLLMIPISLATSVAVCVIGAYTETAYAAFYREITGTALEYREQHEIPESL